jgi:hypothetical protein
MAGTNKPQGTKPPLAAQAAAAKLAQENARVAAAGPAAGSAQPRDTTRPLAEAVAANLEEYNARTAAQGAMRDGTEAVQQGGRAFGEGLRQNADAARRRGEAANETFRRGAQAVVESQRQIAQDAAQRFEEVSRKVADAARGTTENVRRLTALPNAADGGLRDFQQGVAGLFEGVVRTNLRVAQAMFRLGSPAPFVELQQRFAREYTDALLRNSAALVRAVRRTADEALRPLEQQSEQGQRAQANENNQRVRTAAE